MVAEKLAAMTNDDFFEHCKEMRDHYPRWSRNAQSTSQYKKWLIFAAADALRRVQAHFLENNIGNNIIIFENDVMTIKGINNQKDGKPHVVVILDTARSYR